MKWGNSDVPFADTRRLVAQGQQEMWRPVVAVAPGHAAAALREPLAGRTGGLPFAMRYFFWRRM